MEGRRFVRVRGQLVWLPAGATEADALTALEERETAEAALAAFAAALPASFDPDDPRPLLLVDVDGVVCPIVSDAAATMAAGFVWESLGGSKLWLSDEVGARLLRLAASFQLVWCTAWGARAAQLLGPRLGLPAMPVIGFADPAEGDGHWKWGAIERFAGGHPFAWIDDELRPADRLRAETRGAHSLLVQVGPREGLTDAHVEALEAFAARVAGLS